MFGGVCCMLDLLKQGNTSAYRSTPRWVHATHVLTVLAPRALARQAQGAGSARGLVALVLN
eukprot:2345003-Prymnesium_polylepis.1